jgi:pimeloyl-ACP methyl ester carboxylesterase
VDALIRQVSAWDGLQLMVHDWPGDPARPPILCLPGLVRTGGDFADMAQAAAGGRRVVAVDYAGRGGSDRARDVRRYGPEACVRDILDIVAALHLNNPLVIGTSFGGLLALGLAAARPGLMRAVILNDVGPELGKEGFYFVRSFVGYDPACATLEECAALLRARLPPLSLETDADWRRMAELTYRLGQDGRYHPQWDTRLTELLAGPVPDLWPLWQAMWHRPVLLIRGAVSNILLPATVLRMQATRPDMKLVTVPGVGHAPTLAEPVALAAIVAFLEVHA